MAKGAASGVGQQPKLREDARRNREAVIDAALVLLGDQPEASMKEIADASGVGRTTVYRHFATRDELYQAMYERAVSTTWVAAEQVVERGEPLEPTLFQLAERMVEVGLGYRYLLQSAHTGSAAMQASRRSPHSPFRRYFEEAQRRGEIRGDLTVGWILSMFQALCLVAMQDLLAGHQDESATADLLAESLISLLLPRERP